MSGRRRAGVKTSGRRRPLDRLAYFRELAAGKIPRPGMTELLDLRMLEVEKGRVVFGAVPTAAHYNGMGVVHGGLAATLLDSALGCAINTMAPRGKAFTTLELKVNFTRPLTQEVGPVTCEARVVHVGSRVATGEARVVDRSGKLYAHGTTTCILYEPGRARRRHGAS